jgi:hypothetical protein
LVLDRGGGPVLTTFAFNPAWAIVQEVGLDTIGVMKEEREWHHENAGDHGLQSNIDICPGQSGGGFEQIGGAQDQEDDLGNTSIVSKESWSVIMHSFGG